MAEFGSKTCARCGGRMEAGYMLESTHHHSRTVSEWIEGAPERGFFGLKLRGRKRLPIETYRCQRCTYLESYAPEA